jgi:uncharacterized membrane protein YsdA (DUF1294 family)
MTQSTLTALGLCFCGGAIWVRRKTWRIQWDRALTMSFLFQGLGFALCAPAMSHYLGHALFRISGVAHLLDFFGHVLFICAICCIIYACACRLVPDHELESVLYKIELPGAIAAGTMLAAITLSHNLSREPPPDFLDVPCDFWLRVYWLTYGAIVIYLQCFLVRLLWVLRRDPRSRLISDLFIIAIGLGLVSFTVLLARIIINPGLVARFWIWTPACVAGGLAAFAAAWSWRERMGPRSRRRPPPIQLGGGPES